ncbi:MAG: DinB family protein, partial [Planctomycetota bacterium]
MDAIIAPGVSLFNVGNHLIEKSIAGLSRDQLLKTFGEAANPMLWVFGHVTHSRCLLLQLLGSKEEAPWKELFGRGAAPPLPEKYPDLMEILGVWKQAASELQKRLEAATDEQLSSHCPVD